MRTSVTKSTNCPTCHVKIDVATAIDDDVTPVPGNYTLCAECGDVLVFTDDMGVRGLSQSEIDRIKIDEPGYWAEIQRVKGILNTSPSILTGES